MYKSVNDFFEWAHVSIQSYSTRSGLRATIVVPGPKTADGVRKWGQSKFKSEGEAEVWSPYVYTYAEYLKKLTQRPELNGGNEKLFEEIIGKADIFLPFLKVWKKFFYHLPDDLFFESFLLYSEIRSFTGDLNLAQEILTVENSPHDAEILNIVTQFWNFATELPLLDEPTLIFMLAERLKKISVKKSPGLVIFWDFHIFSGIQVDLMKSLAFYYDDVWIPLSHKIWDQKQNRDWMSWLDADLIEIPAIILNHDVEKKKSVKYFKLFPDNGTNLFFYQWTEENRNKNVAYILAETDPDLMQFLEFVPTNGKFQSKMTFLTEEFNQSFQFLKERLPLKESDFISIIQHQLIKNKNEKNFRSLKINLMWIKYGKEFFTLFHETGVINQIDLLTLGKIIELNLPRLKGVNFHDSMELKDLNIENLLYGFDEFIDEGNLKENFQECILILNKHHKLESPYKEGPLGPYIDKLNNLGPVKRSDLKDLFSKEKLREILEFVATQFYVEESVYEENPSIKDLIEEMKIPRHQANQVPLKLKSSHNLMAQNDLNLTLNLKQLSPTQLQLYVDCPRKFYLEQGKIKSPSIEYEGSFQNYELGDLLHLILNKAFKNNSKTLKEMGNLTELKEFIDENYNEFKIKKNKNINPIENIRNINSLYKSLPPVLNEFKNIVDNLDETQFFSEMEVKGIFPVKSQDSSINYSTRIDLVLQGEWGFGIIDFKRTHYSIPTNKKEFGEFHYHQLWFYLMVLREKVEFKNSEVRFLGYYCLENPFKSMFWVPDGESENWVKGNFPLLGKSIFIVGDKENINWEEEYLNKFHKDLEELFGDTKFSIRPRNKKICEFCYSNKICPKVEN